MNPNPRQALGDSAAGIASGPVVLEGDFSIAEALAAAFHNLEKGYLPQADTIFRQILSFQPDNLQALFSCAEIASRLGRGDAAARLADKIISTNPDDPLYHAYFGGALQALGMAEEAISAFRQALEIDPDIAEVHCNMGTALRFIGKIEEARAAFGRATEINPRFALAHSNAGVALKDMGKLDEAVAAYRRAIAIEPGMALAHSNLGVALKDLDRLEEAVASYRRAVEIKPDFADAHCNLGNALKALGKFDEALAAYRHAIAVKPDFAQPYANTGAVYIQQGNPQAAVETCDSFHNDHPMDAGLLTCKGIALTEMGDREGARYLFDFDRFISGYRFDLPGEFANLDAFHDALTQHILSHPTLAHEPSNYMTVSGMHSRELLTEPKGPVAHVEEMMKEAVTRYVNSLPADPDHPFVAGKPALDKINSWAVVMNRMGHQLPHIHPTGWLSGCYYVKIPDIVGQSGSQAGWIEFGEYGPEFGFCQVRPEVKAFLPEEGLMYMFPSYFYHRTIPFDSEQKRICIAYDVF